MDLCAKIFCLELSLNVHHNQLMKQQTYVINLVRCIRIAFSYFIYLSINISYYLNKAGYNNNFIPDFKDTFL